MGVEGGGGDKLWKFIAVMQVLIEINLLKHRDDVSSKYCKQGYIVCFLYIVSSLGGDEF